jgi:phospholipase C
MTQQKFSVIKEGNALMSDSLYGSTNNHEAVPVQPGMDMEFLIFHGHGGLHMSFSISTFPAKDIEAVMSRFVSPNTPSHSIPLNFPTGFFDNPNLGGIEMPFLTEGDRIVVGPTGPGIGEGGPPDLPGGSSGNWPQVPITVKLYRPQETEPIRIWELPQEHTDTQWRNFAFPITTEDGDVVLPNPDLMKKYGWWRCIVTITGNTPAFVHFSSRSFLKNVHYREVTLAKRWLNHAFWNVLNVLTPTASIKHNTILIGAMDELSHATGLPSVSIEITNDLLSGHAELVTLTIEACNGKKVQNDLLQKKNEALHEFETNDPSPDAFDRYRQWNNKYEEAMGDVETDAPALRLMPVFSNPKIDFSKIVDGTIKFEEAPALYICLTKEAKSGSFGFRAYSEISYKISGLNFIEDLAIKLYDWGTGEDNYELIHDINSKIETVIQKNGSLIMRYLFLALSKAAGQMTIAEKLRADSKGWIVTCYDTIKHPEPTKPYLDPHGGNFDDLLNDPIVMGTGVALSDSARTGNTGVARVTRDRDIPEEFEINGGRVSLERLEKIKTLIVIMMENRSFDHFLGDLGRTYPEIPYTCFPLDFTNPAAGNFINPIPVCRAIDSFFPDVNITPISPEHAHTHVMRQISDGTYDPSAEDYLSKLGLMQGFTSDIMFRFGEIGGNIAYPKEVPRFESPQVVMTYYQKEQLHTYYNIAENFMILDHWFAAHPGPTWPNRIATISGKLIELGNFNMSDKRIGYFKDRTIFDVLTDYDIDWAYLESNASIMRIYDKYRIDNKNVMPLHRGQTATSDKFSLDDEDFKELDDILRKEKLPRVIFIEPRFSDAPPLKKAYDDLPPANISNGQEFIKKVCNRLYKSDHWEKLSLLITYDEHGGFFDHVPPPGTYNSDIREVPPIYVDPNNPDIKGPKCMGVRVPALLVSPFVTQHSVDHTIFDHTSILKTILVHNRKKIPPHILVSFGERVNKSNHLGQVLNRETPRPAPERRRSRARAASVPIKLTRSGKTTYYDKGKGIAEDDYHESLRTLFMPK